MGDQHALVAAASIRTSASIGSGASARRAPRRWAGGPCRHGRRSAGAGRDSAARSAAKRGAEAVVQRQHLVTLGLCHHRSDQALQPLGSAAPDRGSRRSRVQVVELPPVGVEGVPGRVEGHRLPAVLPQAAVAEHLEVLRLGARGGPDRRSSGAKLSPSIGICARRRSPRAAQAADVEQRRRQSVAWRKPWRSSPRAAIRRAS
jgi:hypothetical protein